jgi:hypothetical protein
MVMNGWRSWGSFFSRIHGLVLHARFPVLIQQNQARRYPLKMKPESCMLDVMRMRERAIPIISIRSSPHRPSRKESQPDENA